MRLTPAQRVQLLEDCRAFARVLCPGIRLDGDPTPQPLRPDDAGAIADDVDAWLAKGAL